MLSTYKFKSCSDSFVFNESSICNALRILSLLFGYSFLPKNFETSFISYFFIFPLLLESIEKHIKKETKK